MSEYDILKKSKLKFKNGIKKSKETKCRRSKVKIENSSCSTSKDEAADDAEDHGGWWIVNEHEHIRGDVVIEFLSGCYARAMNNGLIVLGNPHPLGEGPDEEEIFTAVGIGTNQIALKSGFDRYWTVDSRQRIMGLSEAVGESEIFLAVFEDKNAAICAANDLFISPDTSIEINPPILAKSEKAGAHEMLAIRINHRPSLFTGGQKNKEDSGTSYDAEINHLKKFQKLGTEHALNDDKKNLKKARIEGQLYEALLDKRTEQKSDKYCK